MDRLHLTSWQRRRLRRQLREACDVRLFRRTLAVLEFDQGRSAADIARMLGVTRQTVHNWLAAFATTPPPDTLAEGERPGRPRLLDEDDLELLESLLDCSPPDVGFPHVRGSNKTYSEWGSSCKRRKQMTQAASVSQASWITAKRS